MSPPQEMELNPDAKAELLRALDDQLRSAETPEVKAELMRLLQAGVKEADAREMMAAVMAIHLFRAQQGIREFSYEAYLAELHRLPELDLEQQL